MKKNIAFAFLASSSIAAIVLAGCSSGDNGSPSDSGTDATATDAAADAGSDGSAGQDAATDAGGGPDATVDSGVDGGAFPAPPTLGTEIDRLGRPAVNTALNHVFDTNTTTKNAAKDTYNADNVTTDWTTNVPQFEANLAIYDGLDQVCGNQVAFMDGGAAPNYTTLASVLSGDALWLNTATTTCSQYLGVEIHVLNASAPIDCGGRTLTENVVDTTYNAVAGTLNISPDAGVTQGPLTNGITAPAAGQVGNGTFPYLAAPHGAPDAGAPEDSGAADTGAADAGADGAIRDAGGQ